MDIRPFVVEQLFNWQGKQALVYDCQLLEEFGGQHQVVLRTDLVAEIL